MAALLLNGGINFLHILPIGAAQGFDRAVAQRTGGRALDDFFGQRRQRPVVQSFEGLLQRQAVLNLPGPYDLFRRVLYGFRFDDFRRALHDDFRLRFRSFLCERFRRRPGSVLHEVFRRRRSVAFDDDLRLGFSEKADRAASRNLRYFLRLARGGDLRRFRLQCLGFLQSLRLRLLFHFFLIFLDGARRDRADRHRFFDVNGRRLPKFVQRHAVEIEVDLFAVALRAGKQFPRLSFRLRLFRKHDRRRQLFLREKPYRFFLYDGLLYGFRLQRFFFDLRLRRFLLQYDFRRFHAQEFFRRLNFDVRKRDFFPRFQLDALFQRFQERLPCAEQIVRRQEIIEAGNHVVDGKSRLLRKLPKLVQRAAKRALRPPLPSDGQNAAPGG